MALFKLEGTEKANKTDIIPSFEELKANWNDSLWLGWHSQEYIRNPYKVRDDEYLAQLILKLPITNTLEISIPEIIKNWKESDWWIQNFRTVYTIMDTMYVKASVRKQEKFGSVYNNWFSRLVQFCNTYIAEKETAKSFNLTWEEFSHSTLHAGIASKKENTPDFINSVNKVKIEFKLCINYNSILIYINKLQKDFYTTLRNDFHSADIGLFYSQADKTYYFIILTPNSAEKDLNMITNGPEINGLIPIDNKGKVLQANLPAVPKALLFGLTPSWQKCK